MAAVLALPGHLVSPTERLVLISLANHANREGRYSFPSRSTIADETGLSVRTVTRNLSHLRAMGLIGVAGYPGRDPDGRYLGTFTYDLHIPGLVDNPRSDPRPLATVATPSTSTHGQPPSHSVPVTEEPKNRRKATYPQAVGDVIEGMGYGQ